MFLSWEIGPSEQLHNPALEHFLTPHPLRNWQVHVHRHLFDLFCIDADFSLGRNPLFRRKHFYQFSDILYVSILPFFLLIIRLFLTILSWFPLLLLFFLFFLAIRHASWQIKLINGLIAFWCWFLILVFGALLEMDVVSLNLKVLPFELFQHFVCDIDELLFGVTHEFN